MTFKKIISLSLTAVLLFAFLYTNSLSDRNVFEKNLSNLQKNISMPENSGNTPLLASNTLAVTANNTSSTQSSTPADIKLKITSSKTKTINTTNPTYTFTGTSDPEKPLKLNGKNVTRNKNGNFTKKVNLKIGKNTFTFVHKNQKLVYTVNFDYVLVKSYSPSTSQKFESGKAFTVTVKARNNSTVTATFRGQKIKLTKKTNSTATYVSYTGTFTMPKNNSIDINYGKITYKVTDKYKSETLYSENIICKKTTTPNVKYVAKDSNYNLKGGRYLDVGTGKIAEIVCYEAETFNAKSTNDWSRPTNNYLPKGTVDYCSNKYAYYKGTTVTKQYAIMRCGLQVYTKRQDSPSTEQNIKVTKIYNGKLPTYNKIGIVSLKNGTTHTTLTLDTMWKAPFYFNIYPQTYTNASQQNYSISNFTAKYIDITLCYATKLSGKITVNKNNPLFKSAKIIKKDSHHILRLYLKKQGGFYGWTADFNSKGQLVFRFLNPAKIKTAKNTYGYNLKGVRILIDVGHGGYDPGAVSFSKTYTEANRNLYLAKLIKKELESIGATVYMTRTKDIDSTSDDKLKMLRTLRPDYCIAIHHNSNASSSANGFDSYYSQPFSMNAAKYIQDENYKTKIYKSSDIGWHYYYTARSSVCPVVLTENGFMSNSYDYNKIINASINTKKAKAITKGIVRYFASIQ